MSDKGKQFMRRGVTIDPAIVEGLVPAGDTEVWHKFFLAGPRKPVVIKSRIVDVGMPVAGVVYDTNFKFQPKDEKRPNGSISYWEIKLYPPRYGDHNGTLRLFATERDPEIAIHLNGVGEPAAALRFDGEVESCLLYVEPVECSLKPVVVQQEQTEVRRVIAAIQIFAESEVQMASYRYEIPSPDGGDPLVIFDHRQNRLSGFAEVVEVEQEQKGGTFRFFQIRDLDGEDGETPEVTHIFTNAGLQALNSDEA